MSAFSNRFGGSCTAESVHVWSKLSESLNTVVCGKFVAFGASILENMYRVHTEEPGGHGVF